MNKRQRKKNLKAKYGIKRIPRGLSIKYVDEFMKRLHMRIGEALDRLVLYGDVEM